MARHQPIDRLPRVLLLDDGGVINDNRRRGPEWLRLLAELMPERLGGEGATWAAVNRPVFSRVWAGLMDRLPTITTFEAFQREYATGWLKGMCAAVAVPYPGGDRAEALYREVATIIAEQAVCDISGAADAIRMLHAAGFTIHTASGTPSWELEGILGRMGIRTCFVTLYGPDFIDKPKYGRSYFDAIFHHAGINPADALVIESEDTTCGWARKSGAQAIRVDVGTDTPSLADVARMLTAAI